MNNTHHWVTWSFGAPGPNAFPFRSLCVSIQVSSHRCCPVTASPEHLFTMSASSKQSLSAQWKSAQHGRLCAWEMAKALGLRGARAPPPIISKNIKQVACLGAVRPRQVLHTHMTGKHQRAAGHYAICTCILDSLRFVFCAGKGASLEAVRPMFPKGVVGGQQKPSRLHANTNMHPTSGRPSQPKLAGDHPFWP